MGCREKLEPSSARCCLSSSSESAAEDRMLRTSSCAHRFAASFGGFVAEAATANPASTIDAASRTSGSSDSPSCMTTRVQLDDLLQCWRRYFK